MLACDNRSLKGGDGNLKLQPSTLGKREGQAFTCHVEGVTANTTTSAPGQRLALHLLRNMVHEDQEPYCGGRK
jgi:hypothetical protein